MKKQRNPNPERDREREVLRRQRHLDLLKAGILLGMIFLLFYFVLGIIIYHGNDMEPAIKDGDLLLYYRLYSKYNAGDAVVYRADDRILAGRISSGTGEEKLGEDEYFIRSDKEDMTEEEDTSGEEDIFGEEDTSGEEDISGEEDRSGETDAFGGTEREEDSAGYEVIREKDIKGKIITIFRRRGI